MVQISRKDLQDLNSGYIGEEVEDMCSDLPLKDSFRAKADPSVCWWDVNERHGITGYKQMSNKIRRDIRTFIGKDWDDIYSVLKQKYPDNIMPHLYGVLYDLERMLRYEIETKTYIGEDGEIYYNNSYATHRKVTGLYVHPTTNILCEVLPQPKIKPKINHNDYKILDLLNGDQLENRKGIWYYKSEVKSFYYNKYYAEYLTSYDYKYKQLNAKELKYYELHNHI